MKNRILSGQALEGLIAVLGVNLHTILVLQSSCVPVHSRHHHSGSLQYSHYTQVTCKRATHSMAKTSADVPEGVLMGLGNPLLDITVTADENFLKKYELEPNNAILANQSHQSMFKEMVAQYQPTYGAGGATQNSIRIAQWLLGKRYATTFFGCVGRDENALILKEKAEGDGVNVHYQVEPRQTTGVCGAIITGEDRSLVASLGAADYFMHKYLEAPVNWQLVQQAQFFYIGGFVFPVCTQGILDIAHHASDNNKTLAMNLSAPVLCQYFADSRPNLDIMPFVDILFGNESEAKKFCELRGLNASDITDMALKTSELPKRNKHRSRTVVFTQGRDPTIVAKDGHVTTYPIKPVDKADIKDTNGCGDAFVGGFLAQSVQGKSLEECVRCGAYAAKVVIQHWGCNYPDQPDFF